MLKLRKLIVLGIVCAAGLSLQAQEIVPSKEQRIYTLSTIWKELEYNFAFPENLKKANLDSLYLAYLPKVEAVKDQYEYYRTLSSFLAHFNEAHTRIIVDKRPDDMPPLMTTNFGDIVVVKNIAQSLSKHIPIGSEILKVNNIPVITFLKDSIYPYISAATPHWKLDKSVTEMLYGRPLTEVKLSVRTPKGREQEISLLRNYYTNGATELLADTTSVPPLEIKILKGGIGYIHLNTCNGGKLEEINRIFYNNLNKLLKCRGLIVDMRGNRGGTDEAWYPIVFHLLTDKKFSDKAHWMCRKHIATYRMYGQSNPEMREYYENRAMQEIFHSPYENVAPDSLKLNQPVVILSGQYVGSAAEGFLIMMKNNGRAKIIGEHSVGCVGEPTFIDLPGGYCAMISVKKCVDIDGTQPNDKGILPDIEVKRDYRAYLQNKDHQLERAIEELGVLIGKNNH